MSNDVHLLIGEVVLDLRDEVAQSGSVTRICSYVEDALEQSLVLLVEIVILYRILKTNLNPCRPFQKI